MHRLYRLKNDGMDLHTYSNYMKRIKDEFGVNYDIIVAEFVNKWFGDVLVARLPAPVAPSLYCVAPVKKPLKRATSLDESICCAWILPSS